MQKFYFVTEEQAKVIKKLLKASRILYDNACDRGENWDNEKDKEYDDYHALGVAIRACRKADAAKADVLVLALNLEEDIKPVSS